MIGDRPFAVAIHAGTDPARIDWRADYDALTYTPIEPPGHTLTGMVRYLHTFGLAFGAFDFTVTPQGYWVFLECNPSGQWLWLQEQAGLPIAEEWLSTVYSDDSLTTQYCPVPGTDLMWPTSSSTRPSLMAHMLDLLDVRTGHRVLEVGTGTGYNAALLCHRLGDRNVASIDIDPDLVATARARLTEFGRQPVLVSGDGAQGIPEAAPFDRIIATCAVPAVPPAWIVQVRAGGVIVTDLRGELASNLAVLHKTDPTTVEGRFRPVPGHFMWLRTHAENPLHDGSSFAVTIDRDGAAQRMTRLDPGALDDPGLRFLLQWRDPTIQGIWRTHRGAAELLCIHYHDGAWAEVDTTGRDGRFTVTQCGPRRIWDQVERTADQWSHLGQPCADRFGVTANTDRYWLWLDTPDTPIFD